MTAAAPTPSLDTVEQILSADGPIASALAARGITFEPRPEQTEMARAVAKAMETSGDGGGTHLLVEAGTGVGKSFAYLVPAILRCCLLGQRVVVATNTIALQEQLVEKDIPLLQHALEQVGIIPRPRLDSAPAEDDDDEPARPAALPGARPTFALKPVLVKGRGNYISIRRLEQASKRQDRLFGDPAARRTLHIIEDWAYATTDGTLSTLPTLERLGVWDKVQSDSANCMGRHCPRYRKCFYQSARRDMEKGNLLITNHALFFSDLALRSKDAGFLPAYQHVILDEAHNVEDVAAEHFGISLSEGRIMHLLTTLYQVRSGKGYLPQLQVVIGDANMVDGAVRLVLAAENAAHAFFENLLQFHRTSGKGGRIRTPGIVENTLSPAMKELVVRLKMLRERLTPEPGQPPSPDRYELNAYIQRATAIADDAEALINQSLEGCAYWVEVSGGDDGESGRARRGSRRITIACSPIEVGPILKDKLFGTELSVTLTSATLASGGGRNGKSAGKGEAKKDAAFAHAMSRLGCEGARTLLLGSPFDHASQVELYIERSMPRPEGGKFTKPVRRAAAGDEYDQSNPFAEDPFFRPLPPRATTYESLLADRIVHHLDATDGGAFVLFTSFATLNKVAELLRDPLEERSMPLLVQGASGSRTLILQQFREDERSVLLGAASFWQGVDVRGRGLRNVIITRLPFEPPDRPLTEARLERITERGGDPFFDDSLPRAIIRFKQGFGRLIRSRTDRGRVVVLDPRIVTTGYGRRFLAALPAGVRVVEV